MNISAADRDRLNKLLAIYGRDTIESQIRQLDKEAPRDLTIVANGGLHSIPNEFIFGELYVASEGNLDFSSIESVNAEIANILTNLRTKLKSRRWSKVYLIPFGHAVISMNIKMAVYRTIRVETSEVFYLGNGKYGLVEIDTRRVMLT